MTFFVFVCVAAILGRFVLPWLFRKMRRSARGMLRAAIIAGVVAGSVGLPHNASAQDPTAVPTPESHQAQDARAMFNDGTPALEAPVEGDPYLRSVVTLQLATFQLIALACGLVLSCTIALMFRL